MKNIQNLLKENYLALLLFLIALLINQYTGNRGVFPIDSFSHFDSGFRILKGDHPFKDYWVVSGPIIDYLQSIFFFLFGINWQSYVFHASFINGLLTLLTFYLFLNLQLDKYLSFFYSLCFAILSYPSSGTPFVDHHSAFFSLASIYYLIRALNEDKTYQWTLIPVFLSLSFLSKQVPAFYIFLSIIFTLIFHLSQIEKKKALKILSILFLTSFLILVFFFLFLRINSINFQDFIHQYVIYPKSIGDQRFLNLKYDFKNTFLNFKFIYLAFFFLLIIATKNLLKKKNFYKKLDFKIFLITFLLSASLIQHILLTKNQIFIFFLIPLICGLAHSQLETSKVDKKKLFASLLIVLCLFVTIKYHLRFNFDRKFHELSKVDFSMSADANLLSKEFKGLKWISPNDKALSEINYINGVKLILDNDISNIMVVTNYSLFSVLTKKNVSSFSRWFAFDGSAFPLKNDKYYEKYKDFIFSTIKSKNIENIYVLKDINYKFFLDYFDQNCINKKTENKMLKIYQINHNCVNLKNYGKKK